MRDALIRAFLVVGGISAVAAWTWPGVFPEADPVAVLVRYHTPNVYAAVVAWYYVAPGVAVFLVGQFLISTSRIWFAPMGVSVGLRSRLPAWPLSPTADGPAIVVGEVHHSVKAIEIQSPEWLTIPGGDPRGAALRDHRPRRLPAHPHPRRDRASLHASRHRAGLASQRAAPTGDRSRASGRVPGRSGVNRAGGVRRPVTAILTAGRRSWGILADRWACALVAGRRFGFLPLPGGRNQTRATPRSVEH